VIDLFRVEIANLERADNFARDNVRECWETPEFADSANLASRLARE